MKYHLRHDLMPPLLLFSGVFQGQGEPVGWQSTAGHAHARRRRVCSNMAAARTAAAAATGSAAATAVQRWRWRDWHWVRPIQGRFVSHF